MRGYGVVKGVVKRRGVKKREMKRRGVKKREMNTRLLHLTTNRINYAPNAAKQEQTCL